MVARELRQLFDHDRASRHVDADGEGLGGEHHLEQASDEAPLDRLLERRHHAGMVRRDAGVELGEELAVSEHGEIGLIEAAEAIVDYLFDRLALDRDSSVVRPRPRRCVPRRRTGSG